jgi:hypothetical protein
MMSVSTKAVRSARQESVQPRVSEFHTNDGLTHSEAPGAL